MKYNVDMRKYICESCGREFERDRGGERPIRFCSLDCYWDFRRDNIDQFYHYKKGYIPWSKGKRGIHFSPKSEFKKGNIPANKLPIGSVRLRRRRREKESRAYVKVAEPNVWKLRAHVVWEKGHGKIPSGMIIHHIDRNQLNDSPDNLVAVSRAWHIKEHSIKAKKISTWEEGIEEILIERDEVWRQLANL